MTMTVIQMIDALGLRLADEPDFEEEILPILRTLLVVIGKELPAKAGVQKYQLCTEDIASSLPSYELIDGVFTPTKEQDNA